MPEKKPASRSDELSGEESVIDNQSVSHEVIAVLAYQLWEERGRPDGTAEKDWLEAEQQLSAPKIKIQAA